MRAPNLFCAKIGQHVNGHSLPDITLSTVVRLDIKVVFTDGTKFHGKNLLSLVKRLKITKTPIKHGSELSEVLLLIGELCSTFGASSLQNFSAVCSSHSFTETVFLFSLTLFGLVGSKHNAPPLLSLRSLYNFLYIKRIGYEPCANLCKTVRSLLYLVFLHLSRDFPKKP